RSSSGSTASGSKRFPARRCVPPLRDDGHAIRNLECGIRDHCPANAEPWDSLTHSKFQILNSKFSQRGVRLRTLMMFEKSSVQSGVPAGIGGVSHRGSLASAPRSAAVLAITIHSDEN